MNMEENKELILNIVGILILIGWAIFSSYILAEEINNQIHDCIKAQTSERTRKAKFYQYECEDSKNIFYGIGWILFPIMLLIPTIIKLNRVREKQTS